MSRVSRVSRILNMIELNEEKSPLILSLLNNKTKAKAKIDLQKFLSKLKVGTNVKIQHQYGSRTLPSVLVFNKMTDVFNKSRVGILNVSAILAVLEVEKKKNSEDITYKVTIV